MSKEAMKLALEAAYLAGFDASGEGYNAEYPFGDHNQNPEEDAVWIKDRDNALHTALAEQPAQQEPVAWAYNHIKATLAAFGPGEAINLTQDTWSKLHEAMRVLAEQPAQPLPFGVGGGLVAIKTLLSRDPCVHANTAIQMIDTILAEQPTHQEPAPLRDAMVANLVREGINKHKARELADHFINLINAMRKL